MKPYRLAHGSALSEGEAAQLITRAAAGEALTWAPVRRGTAWVLAHLHTLTAQERAQHARRVTLAAQVLDGCTTPARLTA